MSGYDYDLEYLEKMDEIYRSTGTNYSVDVPEGKYVAAISNAFMGVRDNGSHYFLWEFQVLEGEYAGGTVTKFSNIDAKGIPYFKTNLVTMGIEINSLTEIAKNPDYLIGRVASITVKLGKPSKTGKRYMQCYINELLSAKPDSTENPEKNQQYTPGENAGTSNGGYGDDIPF